MQALKDERIPPFTMHHERIWPLDARMAIFVLEAAGDGPQAVRDRNQPRRSCRIMATLHDDDARDQAILVYVRDFNERHIGFISPESLPIGKTVWLNCAINGTDALRTPCRIGRVRTFMQGWNEGMLEVM